LRQLPLGYAALKAISVGWKNAWAAAKRRSRVVEPHLVVE